jgi:hypothetical protein
MAIAALGLAPLAPLAALRAAVGNPAQVELTPGSATLAGIAAGEPVPGITYHTFGGTSTNWLRLWAKVFTPESTMPALAFLGIPLPFFHWSTSSVPVGSLLNYPSFLPTQLLVGPTPVITETMVVLAALSAAAPELAPNVGDTFVTDVSARLPFAATHATNPLNHLEALYDPSVQRQVIALLSALRSPVFSGRATVTLTPFPAKPHVATHYTVTAADAVSGLPLTPQSVTVRSPHGGVLLTSPGASFTFSFVQQHVIEIDPQTHRPVSELVWPGVSVQLPAPYNVVDVPTGLP